ncbi:MAG TPA: mannitol-1-phosphate 5-dehydrogenase, partial [Bacillaceae bacterium]|nr:mannitol-1-phosphate 5-dehydrogenase [Bacillaceae bacterium]
EGMIKVADLAPYIERKLFTVNTGHAVTAYLGFLDGKETIDQSLKDSKIYQKVKATLGETGAYLTKRYQLDEGEHQKYIEKIIVRFQNKHLHDDVNRVGRSPIRKLGPNDRLIKPMVEAQKLGLSFQHLASAVAACLLFDVQDDPESVELQKMIKDQGITYVLKEICQLDGSDDISKVIIDQYETLKG